MKVVIVEDEPMAAARLEQTLYRCANDAEVVATLHSVRDTVNWLRHRGSPDLMFLDVRLSDGQSWEIFQHCRPSCPVIFTTAYDNYLPQAFAANGIEYLMKPVEALRLSQALEKYRQLENHFQRPRPDPVPNVSSDPQFRRRERFLVRRGAEFLSLPVDRVAYFYTEHKLTFLVDCEGRRYLLDDSLTDIEQQVEPRAFFRANRQYLVAINAIRLFRPAGKGQIALDVLHGGQDAVVISQERAGDFRRWLDR